MHQTSNPTSDTEDLAISSANLGLPSSKASSGATKSNSDYNLKSDSNFVPSYTLQSIFQDQNSPQKMALEWLQEHPDFATMPIWRRQQLIALATLLVAQTGKLPHSHIHECDWSNIEPECDADGRYRGFHLQYHANNNQFSIPREIGLLTSLTSLQFTDRDRVVGHLPTELGQLTALSILSLQGDRLSGTLPTQIGRLTRLTKLSLFENEMTGTLPSELGQLTTLENMLISYTKIHGPLPGELSQLTSLSELHLGFNSLTGRLPTWLSKLTRLTTLQLGKNQFTGSIPEELGDLTSLLEAGLEGNLLNGQLPASLLRWSNLVQLELFDNHFDSTLPTWLAQWTSLQILYLHQNQWTGTLPSIESLKKLQLFKVQDNPRLYGRIPDETCSHLTSLASIQVDCERVTCTCAHCKCM